MTKLLIMVLASLGFSAAQPADSPVRGSESGLTAYVDPMIGADKGGGVVVGPTMPFGMVRPGPDAAKGANSGWAPIDVPLNGFTQTHLSGTGGNPRYGNILLMPFTSGADAREHIASRTSENASVGYYSTLLDNGTKVEMTSGERAVMYRFSYPEQGLKGVEVDAGYARHNRSKSSQRVTDCMIRSIAPGVFEGYSTVVGGWGGGYKPYTVYFHAVCDKAPAEVRDLGSQLNLLWDNTVSEVNFKIGISFRSIDKARANMDSNLPDWDFAAARSRVESSWEKILGRITIAPDTPDKYKRMFYSAVYHSLLMPADRRGEWAKAQHDEAYYDDFFTLWDTYRTVMPLVTIIDPQRQADIVQGLINVYKYDGWMPDGRSGNANGTTQGSSNADIVIADAFVKGLQGIDYETGLKAMLKNATVAAPKENKEGRVGINYYNTIGYLPWGVSVAGSRTVDHSMCDYAIHTVAKGLGHDDTAAEYLKRSRNWHNLWRDYEEDGIRGFIMPRDSAGNWLDSTMFSRSDKGLPDTLLIFKPKESFPKSWLRFFYEANVYETSLGMTHDMDYLIKINGGKKGFKYRLDRLFEQGCYNGGNEPSFMTTSLYHWVGRPDLTSDICNRRVRHDYSDGLDGIPGNDDSGAMSSWMAWHMIGMYPVAGFDYYLLHAPVVESVTFSLANGNTFTIKAEGLSDSNCYIRSARLNGKNYPWSTISHADLMKGGELVLEMDTKPGKWGKKMFKDKR